MVVWRGVPNAVVATLRRLGRHHGLLRPNSAQGVSIGTPSGLSLEG